MSTKAVTVNAIGFMERERRMIKNILSLASNKEQAYLLVADTHESAEMVIVNADDPAAMRFWDEHQQSCPEASVVLATATPLVESEHVCIRRPLIASQLHGVLALGGQSGVSASRSHRYEALGKSFLFRNLSPGHLEKIVGLSRVMNLPARQVVFERDNVGEEMLVVLSGRLKIGLTHQEGREIVLGILGPGEIVGEIAMLDGRGRSATATTLTPCELLVIRRQDFMPFLEQNPKAAIDLLSVLALRLRLNTEQLAALLAESEA